MTTGAGDFELTMDELRVVARYVVESAQEVLPAFDAHHRLALIWADGDYTGSLVEYCLAALALVV
ncbi:hypothetical protein ACH4VT_37065, partial [Streptomyces lydicus]